VGAAVLADGRVYAGCNVENSSFPLGVCAERNAVGAAIAAGARRIEAVAVVAGKTRPSPPCGGCRQVLAEFCDASTPVVYASARGDLVETTLGALLPDAFGRSDLTPPTVGHRGVRAAGAKSTGRRQAPSGKARSAARFRASRSSGR
jgi:cytidine deaminase